VFQIGKIALKIVFRYILWHRSYYIKQVLYGIL